jgi:hypothetical protein
MAVCVVDQATAAEGTGAGERECRTPPTSPAESRSSWPAPHAADDPSAHALPATDT